MHLPNLRFSMDKSDVPHARLLSSKTHIVPNKLRVDELFFQVPLDYSNHKHGHITLFARRVNKHVNPIAPETEPELEKPYLVYLEGGPGFGNREPQDHSLTSTALSRGYQLLLIDHRGTGMSTPVSTNMLKQVSEEAQGQADYLKLMRQDNTVRDCEAVRKCLTEKWAEDTRAWSIFGQSYGGFISLSYLSMHPEGLREVFLTGGLAPVGKTADRVYHATFARTARRNEQYFTKFPEDVEYIREIAAWIQNKGGSVALPGGGLLTVPRLLTLGIAFGGHGGFDTVHNVILQLKTSLNQFGFFSRKSLLDVEASSTLDSNIIYAILHEAIYCDGPGEASNWAAQRVGQSIDGFTWLDRSELPAQSNAHKPYFSGEMMFPLHFETHPELKPLREVADILATYDQWPPLYDQKQLGRNKVPVYAASYVEDMYVDYHFARDTAQLCRGTKTYETNMIYHNGVRAKKEEVLANLFALRDDVID